VPALQRLSGSGRLVGGEPAGEDGQGGVAGPGVVAAGTGRGPASTAAGSASTVGAARPALSDATDLLTVGGVPARPSWWDRAACRGAGVEVFFPGRGNQLAPALAYCLVCPVRAECLSDALRQEAGSTYQFGVRGGLRAEERRRLTPRPRRPLARL
jgi:WhiB family redox-sensing transcriptional regulator